MVGKKKIDKYELITNQLIALLEEGTKPWERGWQRSGFGEGPANILTRQPYRGRNPLMLSIQQMAAGYPTALYVGRSQGMNLGWKIKKGSKACWVMYAASGSREIEGEDGEKREEGFSFAKWQAVFNIACWDDSEAEEGKKIADLMPAPLEPINPDDRIWAVQEFVARTGAVVDHWGDRAFYSPSLDKIRMPEWANFTSAIAYYGTLMHELTHWTGHNSRLDRPIENGYGTHRYAREELVAELGAAFLCDELGIASKLENHASYLDSWLECLKGDKKFLFAAAKDAAGAATFLREMQGEESEEGETPATPNVLRRQLIC